MLRRPFRFASGTLVLALVTILGYGAVAIAQNTGGGNVSGANGVMIDAQGVLHLQNFPDPGGQLAKQRIAEARASLNADVLKTSPLRKVSLNRLEAAIRAKPTRASADRRDGLSGRTDPRPLRVLLSRDARRRFGRSG